MKRAAIFLVFILFALSAFPSAAQVWPVTFTASTNNNAASAFPFSPDAQIFVSGVETATIEASEPNHSCSTASDTKSIWFKTFLQPGTVTMDTSGSSYGTAGGPSFDTVISIYRLSPFNFSTFADLVPFACNDNGTGPGIISTTVVFPSLYYVQISAAPGVVVTSASDVHLTVNYTAAVPFPYDDPQTAKTLKWPGIPSLVGIANATLSLNEPVDPSITSGNPITNSAWFKIKATSEQVYQAQVFDSTPALFSLFQFNGSAYVPAPASAILAIGQGYISMLLDPGTYYLRVGVAGSPAGINVSYLTLGTLAYFMPHHFQFSDNEGTVSAIPSLDGWTVAHGDGNDGAFCDGPASYACYFRLFSAGAGEATTLQSKVKLSGVSIKKGDIIGVQAALLDLVGTPNFTLSLTLTDAAGATQKYVLNVTDALPNRFVSLVKQAKASFKPVKATMKLTNKDTVAGHSVEFDQIIGISIRSGEGIVRDGSQKLAPGGKIPLTWATAAPAKGVLPAPPPAQ